MLDLKLMCLCCLRTGSTSHNYLGWSNIMNLCQTLLDSG